MMVYNLAQSNIQEVPNPMKKFQDEESPFTPNCGNPPTVQQPKAATAATSTAPLTRDDTPWANTIPASTNLSAARASWPIPPYIDEVPTPTSVKTEKAKEKTPPTQAAIPCILIQNKPQNSKPVEQECRWGTQCPICTQMQNSKPAKEEFRWGPQCPICTKATPNIKTEEIEEDWNGDRQRNRKEDQLARNYYPLSP